MTTWKNFKHAVAVVQVQLEATDAPIQLHVERSVAVIEEFEIAMRLGPHVIAVVRADELQLIDPQLFDVRRTGRGERGRSRSQEQGHDGRDRETNPLEGFMNASSPDCDGRVPRHSADFIGPRTHAMAG